MIVKIIRNHLLPMMGNFLEHSIVMQAILFCILNKVQINWAGLVLHTMEFHSKIHCSVRHFPHLICQLLGPGYFNVPITTMPLVVITQPNTNSSFQKKYLNQFSNDNADDLQIGTFGNNEDKDLTTRGHCHYQQ